MPGPDTKKLAASLRAFSDQTRIRLLMALRQKGELCVRDLTERLRLPQPTISAHLGILRRHGLVRARRTGKQVFYSNDKPQLGRLRKGFDDLFPPKPRGKRRRR